MQRTPIVFDGEFIFKSTTFRQLLSWGAIFRFGRSVSFIGSRILYLSLIPIDVEQQAAIHRGGLQRQTKHVSIQEFSSFPPSNIHPTHREEGEEVNPLPYVRLSRRTFRGGSAPLSEADMLETMAIREVSPDRLLATKRIVNAFNAGDVEAIHEIVFDAALDSCEVCFSNLQHVFIGEFPFPIPSLSHLSQAKCIQESQHYSHCGFRSLKPFLMGFSVPRIV